MLLELPAQAAFQRVAIGEFEGLVRKDGVIGGELGNADIGIDLGERRGAQPGVGGGRENGLRWGEDVHAGILMRVIEAEHIAEALIAGGLKTHFLRQLLQAFVHALRAAVEMGQKVTAVFVGGEFVAYGLVAADIGEFIGAERVGGLQCDQTGAVIECVGAGGDRFVIRRRDNALVAIAGDGEKLARAVIGDLAGDRNTERIVRLHVDGDTRGMLQVVIRLTCGDVARLVEVVLVEQGGDAHGEFVGDDRAAGGQLGLDLAASGENLLDGAVPFVHVRAPGVDDDGARR